MFDDIMVSNATPPVDDGQVALDRANNAEDDLASHEVLRCDSGPSTFTKPKCEPVDRFDAAPVPPGYTEDFGQIVINRDSAYRGIYVMLVTIAARKWP
jgi:hypothetical protein